MNIDLFGFKKRAKEDKAFTELILLRQEANRLRTIKNMAESLIAFYEASNISKNHTQELYGLKMHMDYLKKALHQNSESED